MAKIKQPKVPSFVLPVFKQAGIKIKSFGSPAAFEKVLMKFLKRNNVLHQVPLETIFQELLL